MSFNLNGERIDLLHFGPTAEWSAEQGDPASVHDRAYVSLARP